MVNVVYQRYSRQVFFQKTVSEGDECGTRKMSSLEDENSTEIETRKETSLIYQIA
jgi:hypothetical protein